MSPPPGKNASPCLRGEIQLPGDKSISHRYAILAAMARGKSTLAHYSSSQDCQATLDCLRQLGVHISRLGSRVQVESEGWQAFRQPSGVLNAQNSGTLLRLLAGPLAAAPFSSTLTGDESLQHRPMSRIVLPLCQMGAHIRARESEYPPLELEGRPLRGIHYTLPVASAQVKSCLLLAGLTAQGETTVVEPLPTRDHTERALPLFGISLQRRGSREWSVAGPAALRPADVEVPGDFSAAVYFILPALLLPGSRLRLRGVGINPTRTALLQLLRGAGARIRLLEEELIQGEPRADLLVEYSPRFAEHFPARLGGEHIPNLIDEIPALAAVAPFFPQGLEVRQAAELRKKECDRIHAVVTNLRQMGAEVQEYQDGFRVLPGSRLRPAPIQTFQDHRIAMAFFAAGILSGNYLELDHPQCVGISFPEFFETMGEVLH